MLINNYPLFKNPDDKPPNLIRNMKLPDIKGISNQSSNIKLGISFSPDVIGQ